jgi:hypothetical protein
VLAGAGQSVCAKETYIIDFVVDKVGLQIIKSLHGVEAGLMIVVGELRD